MHDLSLPALQAIPDGELLSDLVERLPLSRQSIYELIKALGITTAKERNPHGRGLVSYVSTADALRLQDLASEIKSGRLRIADVSAESGALSVALSPDAPDVSAESAAVSPDALTLLERLQALELASRIGAPLTTAEVRSLLLVTPGSSTITRGRLQARKLGRNCWIIEPNR